MIDRREFLHVLGAAAAAGMMLPADPARAQAQADRLYDLPRFGRVSFLHMTDTHAQLRPLHFREPSVNLGVGPMRGQVPHLVGRALLERFGLEAGGLEAHAFTHLDFERLARTYGRVGGYAHLATLVKRLRASRPGALLLDGGDTWQGSGTAMWSRGQDMIDAALMLGIDAMTLHFESTYGSERVIEVAEGDFAGRVQILAQNIRTSDFEDPVFEPYMEREVGGEKVAVIGQAFPYTPIANPRWMVEDWTFGIREEALQEVVDDARAAGAKVVVLVSHNGMDVDLKLASRVRGLDAVMGGHTHDGVPRAIEVSNGGGTTLVTNGGSNGKFLGVLDFEVGSSGVTDYRYTLLPVFADLIPADPEMAAHIEKVRAPHAAVLGERLAVTEGLLYRRGNFNGTFDQVICDALMAERDAEIAFSPGFRWGPTLLPGEAITMEAVLDMTAITYPWVTLTEMSGEMIKTIMEDVGDNLFNTDPYLQQGGDMVRVGGMTYRCDPNASIGSRISDMRVRGEPVEASKTYRVAGWAPVSAEARDAGGEPVWEVVARYLRSVGTLPPVTPNQPEVVGMDGNPGMAL